MKKLKDFVEDFVATTPIYTTPLNTPGMGNISISQVGSDGISTDPICGAPKPTKKTKKKQAKSLSSLIKEKNDNDDFLNKIFGLKNYDNYSDHDKEIQIKKNESEEIAKKLTFEEFEKIPVKSSIFIHNSNYEKIDNNKWESEGTGNIQSDKAIFDDIKKETKRMFPSIIFYIKRT